MRIGTKMSKSRGRPRQFDEQEALVQAKNVFLTQGFTGTSLDDLSEAMGINRPSLYNAFGSKEEIYRKAFGVAVTQMEEESGTCLARKDLRSALTGFYDAAIDVYFSSDPPGGCFVFCTTPVEAISHPTLGQDMRGVVQYLDRQLADRLAQAVSDGQLPAKTDVKQTAKLAQAVLHSVALRARAGESKSSLRKFAGSFVDSIVS